MILKIFSYTLISWILDLFIVNQSNSIFLSKCGLLTGQ